MGGCIQGGLINGVWTPYNTSISTSDPLGSMIKGINCGLPWFMMFVLILIYVALYILFHEVPGRKKFITMTLVPMVISWIMIGFSWAPSVMGDATTAIFIITTGLVFLTGG